MAALLALLFGRSYLRLRGTTLTAPCGWALAATLVLGYTGWQGIWEVTDSPQISHSALRFAAAALTLCPLMGVLGAKRPQDKGWQWVVLTLWIILVWPAAQAVMLPQGVHVELFVAWKLFLVGLIVVGLLNYLPTRHAISAMLVAAGQWIFLDEFLGDLNPLGSTNKFMTGMACFTIAAALACRPKKVSGTFFQELEPYNSQWLRFRDCFGAFWALRVLGRVNQNAEVRGWPMRLTWSGFIAEEQPTQEQLMELDQSMDSMLRRFV